MLASGIARPLIRRGIKAAGEWFLRTDDEGFSARLAEVRGRAAAEVARRREPAGDPAAPDAAAPAADEAGSAGA